MPLCKTKSPTDPEFGKSSFQASRYKKNGGLQSKYPHLFPNGTEPPTPPSGDSLDPQSLNAFEGIQRNVIDRLLSSKRAASHSKPRPVTPEKRDLPAATKPSTQNGQAFDCSFHRKPARNMNCPHLSVHGVEDPSGNVYSSITNGVARSNSSHWRSYRDSAETSPSKKLKSAKSLRPVHLESMRKARVNCQNNDPWKSSANQIDTTFRFSFNVNNDTFKRTEPNRNGLTSASAENISTRFTPEDWAGKFEAGADYFKPEQKSTGTKASPRRAQSGTRHRGRSPIKVRPVDPNFAQPRSAGTENVMESPGGTKFSQEEWAQHFRPQTFAPPPYPARTPGRKSRGSIARPTMGTAAVIDDSETPDEKPLFGDKPVASAAPASFSPVSDAMDVDTPPAPHNIPVFEEKPNVNTKRPASASQSQSPVDVESLKVNLGDLKIQDLIKTLQLPVPPLAPDAPPPPTMTESISKAAQEHFNEQFAIYMHDWDHFNTKFCLHFFSRKNQNDAFGSKRWEDDQIMELYRRGLKEDAIVSDHWQKSREYHDKVLKEWLVVKEKVKTRDEMEKILSGDDSTRPRKKTH